MAEQAPTDIELEIVPFNPENETGFPDKTVDIQGKPTVIHTTNNFMMKFGIYQATKNGKEPENPFEKIYKEEFEKRGVNKIFKRFEETYPKLNQKMWEEILRREQRKAAGSNGREGAGKEQGTSQIIAPGETDQRDLYFSMGFDAIAPIAKSFDPNFDLKFFTS